VVLSKREKLIAICVGVMAVLLLLYFIVVAPYYQTLDDLDAKAKELKSTQDSNSLLFVRQTKLQPVWQSMLDTGLESDFSNTQSRTQQYLQDWIGQSGVNLTAANSGRAPTQQGDFQAIDFSLDFSTGGQQAMRQLGRLLASLETAEIPIRVSNLKITPVNPGSDQLTVHLVASALYMPGTDASGHPAAPEPDSGDQP
jgi:hypothetical protein